MFVLIGLDGAGTLLLDEKLGLVLSNDIGFAICLVLDDIGGIAFDWLVIGLLFVIFDEADVLLVFMLSKDNGFIAGLFILLVLKDGLVVLLWLLPFRLSNEIGFTGGLLMLLFVLKIGLDVLVGVRFVLAVLL